MLCDVRGLDPGVAGSVVLAALVKACVDRVLNIWTGVGCLCYSDRREEEEGFYSDNKCLFKLHPRSPAEAPVAASCRLYAQLLTDPGRLRHLQETGRPWGRQSGSLQAAQWLLGVALLALPTVALCLPCPASWVLAWQACPLHAWLWLSFVSVPLHGMPHCMHPSISVFFFLAFMYVLLHGACYNFSLVYPEEWNCRLYDNAILNLLRFYQTPYQSDFSTLYFSNNI